VVRWFNSSKITSGAGELNGCQADRHKDGSIKAKGIINGVLMGYWCGYYENGKQGGERTKL
jgi:hypothetical protein